jgi:hypothetical protein
VLVDLGLLQLPCPSNRADWVRLGAPGILATESIEFRSLHPEERLWWSWSGLSAQDRVAERIRMSMTRRRVPFVGCNR